MERFLLILNKYKGKTTITELKELPYGDVHLLYYDYIREVMYNKEQEELKMQDDAKLKNMGSQPLPELGRLSDYLEDEL